ncbi:MULTISPECIES: 7-carboxy-7-deazaguanine synthase [Acidithrix]|uniref:7-carboxy-7-deazaguanine synthase n=1 Tax=Acidithrix ferrooxidans TaxID=1280514 RepID=A0A0D8HCP3_9ACTN|nr:MULTISPECIES: 7-carboxy-7-deazaguanine synthase [Acidithrix]KJF15735.1 7-carboxy-7-deazaguanine synthase [Acidithrix ferrooxidans]
MSYVVKEIFYTLQGEGHRSGRPAVFLRFAGCNLWTGREVNRLKAICQFCDTDFVGTDGTDGGIYKTALELGDMVDRIWPDNFSDRKYVVCTGGEPLLQLDAELVNALHERGFEIAIETNGTQLPPEGIDWICVSPKAGAELNLTYGNELKVVVPQSGIDLEYLRKLDFENFYLQPMENENLDSNIKFAIAYCLENPVWNLSLQTHKMIGIR